MFLAKASVKRPVAMSALIIGLTLLGLYSFFKMNLELMPRTEVPFISVITVYPGAGPEQIETDIVRDIEDAMMTVDGIKNITSTSMENVGSVLLEFNIGVDVDIAATDVRENLDLILADLPSDAHDPKVLKYDINAAPVATLALTGKQSIEDIYDYADNVLRDRITVLPGVADVEITGGAGREVQVLIDRNKIVAAGLTTLDVVKVINSSVLNVPAGRITDAKREFSVEFNAQFDNYDDLLDLQIVNKGGRIVRVRDVADVKMATEKVREKSFFDGQRCVAINVIKRSDANTVEMINALKEAVPDLESTLPNGVKLNWVSDDGRFIEANALSAWGNIVQGVILTAAILFLFLYNFRILLIVSITMPLNIVISFFFMSLFDFTFNLVTLISIGLSVGILVTNSLVVLESIMKKFEAGAEPDTASIEGTSACTSEVLASCITNIVVLFPIARLEGIMGLFLRPLALTMLLVTAVSLFVAFTVIPMLASLLLSKNSKQSPFLDRIQQKFNSGLVYVTDKYMGTLKYIQNRKSLSLAIVVAVFALIGYSIVVGAGIGGTFVADSDMAKLSVRLEFPVDYSLERTTERTLQIASKIDDLPHMENMLVNIGKIEGRVGQTSEGVYLSEISIRLNDRDQRDISIHQYISIVQNKLENVTDAIVSTSIPSPAGGNAPPVQIEIYGDDLNVLDETAIALKEFAENHEGFVSADTSSRPGKPSVLITPKRHVLSDASIQPAIIGTNLRANLEGLVAGTFNTDTRSYDIIVKFEEEQGIQQLKRLAIPTGDSMPVSIAAFADLETVYAPVQILRKNKQRIARFESFLDESLALGNAVALIESELKNGILPEGYTFRASGDANIMAEAQQGLAEAAIIAVVLVILALAAIMESWIQPALILSTVPSALIGVVWALYFSGLNFSIFVIMGSVMLIGIVVNNAILILEYCNYLVVERNVAAKDAIIMAAGDRLRPILMITFAAVLGMLPMALGTGIGAELRNDIGVASAGGIFVSGVLSLVIVPVIYSFFCSTVSVKVNNSQHNDD